MNLFIYPLLGFLSFPLYSEELIIYEKNVHEDSIDSICIKKNSFVTASFDGYVKEHNEKKSIVVDKHDDWVRKVLCVNSNVVSVSNSGIISITNKLNKLNSVKAHSWWISDIAINEDKTILVTVSLDEYVKIWKYPSLELIRERKIYGSNKHHSVTIHSGKAFIGSTSGMVFIEPLSNKALHQRKQFRIFLRIKDARISPRIGETLLSAVSSPNYVFFGDSNGSIYKISVDTYKVIKKLKVSDFAIKAIQWHSGDLYIGSDDGYLRRLSAKTMNNISIVSKFNEAIRTIAIDKNLLYAGFDKGIVRMLKIID